MAEPIPDRIRRAEVLVEALPYIRQFHGHTLVVKLGGSAMEDLDARDSVLADIVLLRFVGMRPVLVHGGGPAITQLSRELGIEPRFVDGLRVTDARTMEIAKMVLSGKISPDLVTAIHRHGGRAMGLSGEDGPTLLVRPHQRSQADALGFVGEVAEVNPEPLLALLDRGLIPVVASLGLGYDGQAYNVNADTVAAELAVALGATKLLILTDVEGVIGEDGERVSVLEPEGAGRLVQGGVVQGGMLPKLAAALRAQAAGVTCHIVDGRLAHALLLELLTSEGIGTMLPAAEGTAAGAGSAAAASPGSPTAASA
ncbi:MAG TPA: acetylglutamate kinase [Candidatus Micrarchaeia archaeon]|nr:acetylglutamate kinase [Candidatus Micrarchaeia archaeon]